MRADSLREYLTGAGSDGAIQPDQAASIGNYRSGVEAATIHASINSAIPNLVINYIAAANGEGNGSITPNDNYLSWQAPGDIPGLPVLVNGTTILESNSSPDKFIRVTGNGGYGFTPCVIKLTEKFNNVFAFSNVLSADASDGQSYYRATILQANSGVYNFVRTVADLGIPQTSNIGFLGSNFISLINSNTGNPISNQTDWCPLLNISPITWSAGSYAYGSYVSASAMDYVNKNPAGTSGVPGISSDWQVITILTNLGTYNDSTTYAIGDYVQQSNIIVTSGTFADWPASGWVRIVTSGGSLREIDYYVSRTDTTLNITDTGLLGTSHSGGANNDALHSVPGVLIGLDTSGIEVLGSPILVIANENTAPVGVTFSNQVILPSVDVNKQFGIWMWRQIPPGAIYSIEMDNSFITTFLGF